MLALFLLILPQITFSSSTELVVVPVSVTDGRGRPVAGLTRDRFRVYDEGRLQPIATFEYGEAPVTVGLIVDRSASMRLKLPAVITALASFVQSARSADELFVVHFNEHVYRETPGGRPFTSDQSALGAALSAVSPHGTTALYDAMMEGLRHVASGQSARKALVVISDGGDNSSRAQLTDVVAAARRVGAVIYTIGLSREKEDRRASDILRRFSTESGGAAYFPAPAEMAQVFDRISVDLRSQYLLGFSPEAQRGGGSVRQIRVAVSAPGYGRLAVRSRSSYRRDPPKN